MSSYYANQAYGFKRLRRPTQQQVEKEIELKKQFRYDTKISPSKLQADLLIYPSEDGKTATTDFQYAATGHSREFDFSGDAELQLLNKIKVPAGFYRRCPEHLKEQIFNFFNRRHINPYIFRMDPGVPILNDDGEAVTDTPEPVRAVLSQEYSHIDDDQLFPTIFNELSPKTEESKYKVALRSFTHDDRLTQLMVEFTDTEVEYNGRIYKAGAIITNSETGHSAIWVEPVVHIPTCSFTHRQILETQGASCRIIHRGRIDHKRIKDLLYQAYEVAQVGIIQLIEAEKTTITKDHALRFAQGIDAFPKRLQLVLEQEWKSEEQIIKAEAARRIILLAQELPLFQRTQIEQRTGQLTGLFKGFRARLEAITKEIQVEAIFD